MTTATDPTGRQHSKIRRREYARQERRDAITVLLDRMDRGVILPAEKALLRQHVLEEQRLSDESRHAANTTTRALGEQREAADAAIREVEAERDQLAELVAAQQRVIERLALDIAARSPMPTRRRPRLNALSAPVSHERTAVAPTPQLAPASPPHARTAPKETRP